MTSFYNKTSLLIRILAKILISLIIILPSAVFAQFTITGKVLNQADTRPVANASVFLSNATIGDKTGNDGAFTLHNVKPGKYDLVVSIIGFDTYSQTIIVDNSNITLPGITIFPKTIALNEVKIKPNDDPYRQKNLDLFEKAFLGTSDLAKECKILNPELLDLKYDGKTGTLTAASVDFLIIENQALGYKIRYLLSNFMLNENAGKFLYGGSVFFEEMKGTPEQEEQWKKRRLEVYEGSKTHFLRAALNNTLEQEGFRVLRLPRNPERPADSLIDTNIKIYTVLKGNRQYRDSLSLWIKKSKLPKFSSKPIPFPLTGDDIIAGKSKQGLFALGCDYDALYIIYDKRHHFNSGSLSPLSDQNNTSNTLVSFNAPLAFFDNNGAIANPASLLFTGAWANKRLAELLPLDYEPQQKVEAPIDSTFIKKITGNLNAFLTEYSIEKTYLHLDKPYYAAGDTIYFKAYVTLGPKHEPSALSSILNVELINPGNKISESIKLKLKDGLTRGDFALPDTLKQGTYRIRAYTNWMRNAGEDYFFDRSLSIVNSGAEQSGGGKAALNNRNKTTGLILSKVPLGKVDVQFFPEGGSMVNGVLSKIAFKAVGPNGLGAEVKGTVTDEQGHQAGVFASQHLGMGIITIMPEAGKKYRAKITYADSSTGTVELPQAGNTGYAFNVDNSDSRNIRLSVTAGKENPEAQINLVAQEGGVIYYYTKDKLVNKVFTVVIPKSKFPSGIVQFTLFSQAGEPMNERLAFVQNPDQLNLNMVTEKQNYSARQKVKINLIAKNKDDEPVTGSFSVTVIDETKVPLDEDNENNILANLLLTSDLKGYIEKPNYYFTGKSEKTSSDLDVLMLTQGYHRFEWQQILNDKLPPVTFQPEKIMVVSGSIKNQSGKPIPYGKVSLLSVSKSFFFLDTVADADGRFVFKHLPIIDSMRYVIQATDKKIRSNTKIAIDNIPPPGVSKNKTDGKIKWSDDLLAFLQSSKDFHLEQIKQGMGKTTIVLKEVVVIDKKAPSKYLGHSSNLNGPGNANDVITAGQFPVGCPVFTDCIAGHMHGIKFIGGTPYYEGLPVLVMIDGVEIYTGTHAGILMGMTNSSPPSESTVDILNTLNISDVASVEFLMDASLAAVYGVKAGSAVILVTTKRGDDDISNSSGTPTFASYVPVGYYKARVFYSPQYDAAKTDTRNADLRTTIYWNPDIITGTDGKASFEFFNADGKGTYRVVVEGIDDNGNIGRQVYNYKVE